MVFNLLKNMLKTGVVTTKEPLKSPPATYRGKISVNSKLCTLCRTCVEVCPAHAISYKTDEGRTFALLEFDYANCIYCGLCVEQCEPGALTQTNLPKQPVRAQEGLVESFYISNETSD